MNSQIGRFGRIIVSAAILILGAGGAALSNQASPGADISAPTGSLDTSFGQGGIVTTRMNKPIWIRGAAVQPDGKIVVVGVTNPNTSGCKRPVSIRYRPDGSLDSTFGKKGIVIRKLPNVDACARSVSIQPSARIVIAAARAWSQREVSGFHSCYKDL